MQLPAEFRTINITIKLRDHDQFKIVLNRTIYNFFYFRYTNLSIHLCHEYSSIFSNSCEL